MAFKLSCKSAQDIFSSLAFMMRGCKVGWGSLPISSSSNNFSPGRRPVISIAMSPSGLASVRSLRPESSIMRWAKSMIFTDSPMSNTNTSPPLAMAPAWMTNCAASGMVMKNRVTSGWVKVMGPPFLICWRNLGTTEPDEPNTLPKRTMEKVVLPGSAARACKTSSAKRLLAPMMLVGRTALSVLTSTTSDTPCSAANCATVRVPKTLFFSASAGLCSTKGTCL